MGLKLENISKNWSEFKLKNIDLTIENGAYFIILGPTGAGKTLLLETIMGFYKPDEGRIFMNDKDITDEPPERRNVGYVSQDCVLFPNMTIRQNIEFGLKMKGVSKTERNQTVDQLLEFTRLKSMAHRRPATLSGGEKQKVALARAIAPKPHMIILDEPLTAIDLETAYEIKGALKRLHLSGKTVIHVTHNQIEGFSLGSKMAILNSGEIVQTGKPKEIFAKPRSKFVARFLGYENTFKAQLLEQRGPLSLVSVNGITLKVSERVDAPDCTIAVRPEDVSVDLSPITDEAMNVLKGTIIEFVDQGPTVSITIDAVLPFKVTMIKRSFIEKNLETGQETWLEFKSDSVKIL